MKMVIVYSQLPIKPIISHKVNLFIHFFHPSVAKFQRCRHANVILLNYTTKIRVYCGTRALVCGSFLFFIPVSTQLHQVYFLYICFCVQISKRACLLCADADVPSCDAWKAGCSARCQHTCVFVRVPLSKTTKTHFLPLMSTDAH